VIEAGSCDILQDFAYQLTLRVVGELLGLPDEVLPGFHAWIGDVFGLMAPIDLDAEAVTTPDDELVAAYTRMHGAYETYLELVRERRRNPGEDLASAMLTLRGGDGAPVLSDDAVLAGVRAAVRTLYERMPDLVAELDRDLEFVPALTTRVVVSQRVSWTAARATAS
jgi:cytochrome P450